MPSRARTAARSAGSRMLERQAELGQANHRFASATGSSGTRRCVRAHQRLEQARQRPELRVARRHLVRVGEEARQVGAVRRLGIAVLEAREDAEHLQVALQAHPFERRARTRRSRRSSGKPRLARHLPVADRPVDLLLFLPRDEGVAQQARRRRSRSGRRPRPGSRGCRGWASATIRLRGIQSRCTATTGWASALATRRSQASAQVAASSRAPGDAAFARHAPLGKERQLAAQQRVVVGRQRRRRDLALPDDEGGDRVAHQRVGPADVARGLRALQRREVELVAEIVEEEKAVRRCRLRERAGACRPACRDQAGDVDEGPHVFLRWRRVHDDDAAAACRGRRGGSGESWRRSTPAAGSRRQAAWRGPTRASQAANGARGPGRSRRWRKATAGGSRAARSAFEVRTRDASWIIDSTNRCAIASARPSGYRMPLLAVLPRSWRDWCGSHRPRPAAASAPASASSAPGIELRSSDHRCSRRRAAKPPAAADHPARARDARPARPRRRGRAATSSSGAAAW